MSFILCQYLQKYLINVEKKGGRGKKSIFWLKKYFLPLISTKKVFSNCRGVCK